MVCLEPGLLRTLLELGVREEKTGLQPCVAKN